MNRVRRAKLQYLFHLLVLGIVSACILFAANWHWAAWILLGGALMIPGRIAGYYWRSLFRGNRCINEGRFQDAIDYLERFLGELKDRPWIRKLHWATGMIYTQNVEAMARANLGVAHINLGDLEAAEAQLNASLELDPENPFVYYNRAVLLYERGEPDAAKEALERARTLGYAQNAIDTLIASTSKAYARIEGRGIQPEPREGIDDI